MYNKPRSWTIKKAKVSNSDKLNPNDFISLKNTAGLSGLLSSYLRILVHNGGIL